MADFLKLLFYVTGFFIFYSFFLSEVSAFTYQGDTVILEPGDTYSCCKSFQLQQRSDLKIFCYHGQPIHLLHTFQSAFLELNITTDKFDLYEGASVAEVEEQYAKDRSSWSFSLWSTQRSREMQLRPFNTTCVGLLTQQDYSLRLVVLRVSYYRLITLLCGVALFFMAPKLGRNTLFHYLSGVSLGVLGSVLILLFLLSRMFPKKPIVYGLLAGGWMVMIYMLNLAWDNMRVVLLEYRMHISAYFVLSASISFLACYRLGPVTNHRTMDIIQWGLQATGLTLVLLSSHFQEATVGLVILMLSVYNFPQAWSSKLLFYWRRAFPPKRKLLSQTEYEEQGARETEKALKALREYCRTPECNPWEISLRLNDSSRFAQFVGGQSHLSDAELMEYHSVKCNLDEVLTDDSDSDY